MQEVEDVKPVVDNGVFVIYDSKMCQYEFPIVLPVNTAIRDLKQIVNNYGSKYFFTPSDFILYRLGSYDNSTGRFDLLPEGQYLNLCNLNDLVDESMRRRFMLLHTMNTLPTGYFKMPAQMQEDIQKNIDVATQSYVREFIIPELDSGNFTVNNIQNPDSL